MKKVYKVVLSGEEEAELQALISKGKTSARKVRKPGEPGEAEMEARLKQVAVGLGSRL